MRVAIFSNAYKPTLSGVVTSMALFRKGLIISGHEVFILAPQYTGYIDDEPFIFRFPAIDLTGQVDLSLPIPIKGYMRSTLRGLQPQLIHAQHPIVMGNLAASFARDFGIPLVFTFHTRYEEYAQKFIPLPPDLIGLVMDEVLISFLKHCAHVIAPTQSMYDIITQKYHPRCPVSVIPTPVDITRYSHLEPGSKRSDWNIPEGELLLYLGRLSPEKNLNLLLDAFRLVSDARPNAHLVLIGKGPSEDALKQLTRELNLTNRVHFVGSVPHEQTPGCLAAADLFVFPSQIETQGLSILEAMAAGTPVIALDAPGVSEIVRMGGGKLAAAATPEAFARTIIDLLDSPEQRAALRAAGLHTASQFSLAQSAQKLTDVYRQALASVTAPV